MNWDRYNELLERRDSGHVEEAILELTRLSEGEEDHLGKAIILMEIANGFRLLGRFSDSRLHIRKACALLGPEHNYYPRAAFQGALLDMHEENWKGALDKLDEILEKYAPVLEMEDHKDLFEEVQRNRGIALAELKRFREALPNLVAYRSEPYERERTLYYIGACEFELGDFDAAKQNFQEMLSLDPSSVFQAYAHHYLGKIFFEEGKLAWAKAEFEKCLACPDRGKSSEANLIEWLVNLSKGLNLEKDVARYSEMLKKMRQ